ncbi:MAG TPA: response regulator [Steroidobacteraceae bacterium]|nr:response regulator [Steroidobacteraceae bacterium]
MQTVLIVDDEVEVGEVIRRVLERAGLKVLIANNASSGLETVSAVHPDIVITDVIMPRVHGVELIRILRERHPQIRVIAISGGGSFGPLSYKPDAISTHAYLAAAREAGAEEVLTKPFDMDALLAAVRRLLPN